MHNPFGLLLLSLFTYSEGEVRSVRIINNLILFFRRHFCCSRGRQFQLRGINAAVHSSVL